MAFNYTYRADDITSWDVDARDLVENRDRELELYSTTIDTSFLNLNADNLTSGTVPSARMTGAYTGITGLGALTSLDVQTTTGTAVRITNTGTGNSFLVEDSASTDATPFVINAAGNVGIGVSSPSNALDVSGNVQITGGNFVVGGQGTFFNTSAQDGIILAPRAGGTGSYRVVFTPTTLSASRTVTLPNATGTMITTGNLSDITSVAATALTGTIASARISGSYTGITAVGTLTAGSIPATLLTGTIASARISGAYTGFSSITVDGASSAAFTLGDWSINANYSGVTGNMGYLLIGNNASDTGIYLRTSAASAPVYIGTSSTDTLTVTTSVLYRGNISLAANNTYQCAALPAFGFNAWAGVSSYNFYNASDIRYKANVKNLPLGLEFLRLLNTIEFTYLYPEFGEDTDTPTSISQGARLRAGLSAQNVKQALETVNAGDYNLWALADKDNPESFQALDYTGLVAPIIKAIQELDARLQQLETT